MDFTRVFAPGCSCCVDELGLNASIPAAPETRNPLSDPKESIRRELTQCQNCWKRKRPSMAFFKCSGCKVEIYCSKDCQRLAWPSHKVKCKIQQEIHQAASSVPGVMDCLTDLRKFTSKHRATLCEAGIQALQLYHRLSNAQDGILLVFLHSRQATRSEFSFYMTGANVVPYEAFEAGEAAELKDQLRRANEASAKGTAGTFFIRLMCMDSRVSDTVPVNFSKETACVRPIPWKEWMMKRLNEGIVS